jgi:hypothetical protein
MDMHLAFANGSLTGDGNDDIGRFLMKGRYDPMSLECHWTKTYVGAHSVSYRGFREGKGIWGTWEIGLFAHGGFHIWPKGEEAGETEKESVEEAEPVDAIGPNPTSVPVPSDAKNSLTALVQIVDRP